MERCARATPAALAIFFAFATLMCLFAAATLLLPGTPLDTLWRVKADEHLRLLAMGPEAGFGFAALTAIMGAAGVGVWQRRRWGWALAIAIFAVNAMGDAGRAIAGSAWEGLIGVAIAALVLWWLLRRAVRALFAR